MDRIRVPPWPAFVPTTAAITGDLPAGLIRVRPPALHLALMAQVMSLRPRTDERIYTALFREMTPGDPNLVPLRRHLPWDTAWSTDWSAAHSFFCVAPPSIAETVVAKFISDGAQGILLTPFESPHLLKRSTAHATVLLQPHSLQDGDTEEFVGLACLHVYVIDSPAGPPTELPQLVIHPDWSKRVSTSLSTLNADNFLQCLEYHPDDDFVHRIEDTLKFGARIGYTGPRFHPRVSPIHPSWRDSWVKSTLTKVRDNERAHGWRSGDFAFDGHLLDTGYSPQLPLFNLMMSPSKGVPKDDKLRHINDMTYPNDGTSINEQVVRWHTPDMSDFEDAAFAMRAAGPCTVMLIYDARHAYKIPHSHPQEWHLHGEHTPFGAAFSARPNFGCATAGDSWDDIGAGIEFITLNYTSIPNVIRYCDDSNSMFAFAPAPADTDDDEEKEESDEKWVHPMEQARVARLELENLVLYLGLSLGKFQMGTRVTWLGLVLDSLKMSKEITPKRQKMLIDRLTKILGGSTITPEEAESIHGHLQYVARVAENGRHFLWQITKLAHARSSRNDHLLAIGKGARADFIWWLKFLSVWSGTALIRYIYPHGHSLETDASKSGAGVYFDGDHISFKWTPDILAIATNPETGIIDIVYLELYAIAIAAATFKHRLARHEITIYTDSETSVSIFTSMHAKKPREQAVVRAILMMAEIYSFNIKLVFLAGKLNIRADPLSRLNMQAFFRACPTASSSPTVASPVPFLDMYC
jgi:hypothetical protein